ncbi:jg6603 [Pararge aegeria aegeria]|uniref:Jg6603 protein n=1 Tax=Pararge aegeria aegeria TaxID=348720 RepID=A0A8S4RXZ8_9NEOP|nr:jg6603 [Pararge aegeria aegeria]
MRLGKYNGKRVFRAATTNIYCVHKPVCPARKHRVARRAFHMLAVRIRNVDIHVSCVFMEYQPHKDATAHGVSLFSGRTGKEEQDYEVPEFRTLLFMYCAE